MKSKENHHGPHLSPILQSLKWGLYKMLSTKVLKSMPLPLGQVSQDQVFTPGFIFASAPDAVAQRCKTN